MKITPITIVVALLVIGGVIYYLQNHYINVNVDIKDKAGTKSHMGLKHDIAKKANEQAN